MNKCFKCGSENHVIKHHISYNPELIVDCCRSCHKKIHDKVRKNDMCPFSPDQVECISTKSSNKRYRLKYKDICFSESIYPYVNLREDILIGDNLRVCSYFHASRGTILYEDI